MRINTVYKWGLFLVVLLVSVLGYWPVLANGRPMLSALEASAPKYSGMTLAAIVMAGMLAAVVFVGWALVRSFQGKIFRSWPAWFTWIIPLLAVAEFGVAIYLSYVETTSAQAVCGPIGDCNSVQDSRYAILLGFLPVGVFGLLGAVAILVVWAWGHFRKDWIAEYAPVMVFGFSVFGTAFSIYLTYLELFVIHAVCMWCVTSAVLMTLLMLAALPPAAAWLAGGEDD